MKRALLLFFLFVSALTISGQQTPPIPQKDPDSVIKTDDAINSRPLGVQDTSKIYTSVEQEPEYPGGPNAYKRYLTINLHYPRKARKSKIQGDVLVTFVVEKDGTLTNITIAKGVSPELDAEALRLITESPKWHPAEQNGVRVRVYYTIPVPFTLTPQ